MAHRYWALLLDEIDEGRFKRVGVAILRDVAYEVLGAGVRNFQII